MLHLKTTEYVILLCLVMSPASPIPQEDSFDLLTSNESCKLSGITAGRAKPPKRRPPSSHFLKENVRFNIFDAKILKGILET